MPWEFLRWNVLTDASMDSNGECRNLMPRYAPVGCYPDLSAFMDATEFRGDLGIGGGMFFGSDMRMDPCAAHEHGLGTYIPPAVLEAVRITIDNSAHPGGRLIQTAGIALGLSGFDFEQTIDKTASTHGVEVFLFEGVNIDLNTQTPVFGFNVGGDFSYVHANFTIEVFSGGSGIAAFWDSQRHKHTMEQSRIAGQVVGGTGGSGERLDCENYGGGGGGGEGGGR